MERWEKMKKDEKLKMKDERLRWKDGIIGMKY